MSLEALLQATRDAIRSRYNLGEMECEVTPDGRPIPACGQQFYAVHPSSSENTSPSADVHVNEVYTFSVTASFRIGVSPQDRLGVHFMLDTAGPLAMARQMALTVVNMNYDLLAAANVIIGADSNGFYKPPVYLGLTWLGAKGPDWFWAEDETECGLAVEARFGRAQRAQYIEEAT